MNTNIHSPFTEEPADQLAQWGEIRLIETIREWLGPVSPAAPAGMGDDCAVISKCTAGQTIATTDTLTYGQHFDQHITARDAGAKLIKRNLSDIAAMGGRPSHALLALLCGGDLSVLWLKSFFQGIRETAETYGFSIAGGDVSGLPAGHFSSVLCMTGVANPPVLRAGARPGDLIYVTGALGGSLLGKHFRFEPRLSEGEWIARSGCCHALIDLTDGLAKDLPALLPQGSSVALDLEKIPLSEAARARADQTSRPPMEHAFCDGEDYELLFAADAQTSGPAFEATWKEKFPSVPLTCIGTIREGATGGALVDAATNRALPWTKGFEHFNKA
ncbi:MAG: thiamine-phosphate kinase [Opitutales bacterium]